MLHQNELDDIARAANVCKQSMVGLESQRWLVWERNYWRAPLDAALAALRGG